MGAYIYILNIKYIKMLNATINNIKISVEPNTTVLQACQHLNIELPKFCFQDNLEIAGNCRMCLVEIKNSPKPVVSCAMPVVNGMEIYTDTPLIKKAREKLRENKRKIRKYIKHNNGLNYSQQC